MTTKEFIFSEAFNALPLPVVVVQKNGKLVYANNAFDTLKHSAKNGESFFQSLVNSDKPLSATTISGKNFELTTRSGRRFFTVRSSELNENIIMVLTDISREKERAVDLMGFAGHELKTPLASIKAFSELLSKKNEGRLDEKSTYYLTKINSKINEQVHLIQDLLDVARVQSGRIELRLEQVELTPLINEIIEDLKTTYPEYAIEKKGEESIRVLADRFRIRQVLNNIISNAIKYSPDKKRVLITLKSSSKKVSIVVQDWGVGVKKQDLQKIFEPYFQENTLKKRAGASGLGVGLYISCEAIKAHGGNISVKSEYGKGSIFTVELPR